MNHYSIVSHNLILILLFFLLFLYLLRIFECKYLKWQKMVENDDALNVNLYDKSISMNLTTEFGHFYLVVYPDIDSVTISSDQGFQIEKVNTMNNMKSWFKRFVSDETTIPVDDNGNDHTYY